MRIAAGSLAAVLLAAGCGGKRTADDAVPSPLTVDASNRGRVLQLVVGQELHVRLPSDPTSGYRWIITADPAAVIRQEGATYFTSDTRVSSTEVTPNTGVTNFRFVATAPGEADLRFEYRDPANAQPQSRAWFRLAVR